MSMPSSHTENRNDYCQKKVNLQTAFYSKDNVCIVFVECWLYSQVPALLGYNIHFLWNSGLVTYLWYVPLCQECICAKYNYVLKTLVYTWTLM